MMSVRGAYWQLYYHFIWTTKNREPLINTEVEKWQKLRSCFHSLPPSPSPSHKGRGVTRVAIVGFFPQNQAFFAAETAGETPLPLREGLGEGGRLWR
jgi:hypothetical protein